MNSNTDKEFKLVPLAESNVSLKLADIQKRCSQLLQSDDGLLGLTLEDPSFYRDNNNPYDQG